MNQAKLKMTRVNSEEIAIHSSRILPVRQNGNPAMLKIALAVEEKCGGALAGTCARQIGI